jgi:anthranilate phosphoribosyltransferase
MINQAITQVANGNHLSEKEMAAVMEMFLSGMAAPAQIGAFITALRMKGETVEEITGAAKAMQAKTRKIEIDESLINIDRDEINIEEETILDTHGNGANGTQTFNISTATALVVAGAGLKVAKYGNWATSRQCGSADVLFHGAMKAVAAPRQQVGLRSIFNLLGPLVNPAGATAQVLGIYDASHTEKMAQVLQKLGVRQAFVVCGEETFDEISICGITRVSQLKDDAIKTFEMTPEAHGFKRAAPEAIKGGDAQANAEIIRNVLDGEKGPKRDVVLLNAAAAFVAAGLDDNFKEGIERATGSIDSGRAKSKLDALIDFTRQFDFFIGRAI